MELFSYRLKTPFGRKYCEEISCFGKGQQAASHFAECEVAGTSAAIYRPGTVAA
ncbi:hypothetical protein ACLOJK_032570 [Asimina triloba]